MLFALTNEMWIDVVHSLQETLSSDICLYLPSAAVTVQAHAEIVFISLGPCCDKHFNLRWNVAWARNKLFFFFFFFNLATEVLEVFVPGNNIANSVTYTKQEESENSNK